MSLPFTKETTRGATATLDRGKLTELDSHQLLKAESGAQIATFDQVREVGRWFLGQKFNAVIPSSQPLPEGLLAQHELSQRGAFWAKLALGSDAESQFPVTVEAVRTEHGRDLRIHIVPIHFGALEVAQFGQHTDSLLALAAAAAGVNLSFDDPNTSPNIFSGGDCLFGRIDDLSFKRSYSKFS
jgi:hypothetical protein